LTGRQNADRGLVRFGVLKTQIWYNSKRKKDENMEIEEREELHGEELFANWKLLEEEGTYFKIEPLR
jgi:hypothetical protein